MTKNWEKFTTEKKLIFFDQKLQYTYSSLGLHKGRFHATEEVIIPQKRTSSTSKLYFCGLFCPPGSWSGSSRPKWMQIRIRNTAYYWPCPGRRVIWDAWSTRAGWTHLPGIRTPEQNTCIIENRTGVNGMHGINGDWYRGPQVEVLKTHQFYDTIVGTGQPFVSLENTLFHTVGFHLIEIVFVTASVLFSILCISLLFFFFSWIINKCLNRIPNFS